MSHVSKIDLHLTQLILKTKNLKNDKREVLVGGLNENMSYIKNNPLNINVNNSENKFCFYTSLESKSEFDIQYIYRIQNTPFFVSYLSNDDFAVKILDFYDWRDNNSIYRLFLLKKFDYNSSSNCANIELNFDSNINQISENQIELNKVMLQISDNIQVNKDQLTYELSTSSEGMCFFVKINYDANTISSLTLDNVIKKFYELENICRINHISRYFITKNHEGESELDELWNRQKYILPDLDIEEFIFNNENSFEIEKYWVDDFCKYFGLTEIVNFNINNPKAKESGLREDFPSKSNILNYYKDGKIETKIIANDLQKWWDTYSLPLFDLVFKNKCINEPEEVFAAYFLAIRLHFPWAVVLYEKIISNLEDESTFHLHHFLNLLSFCNKRIIKQVRKNKNIVYVPGYLWDNNYKSINNEIEVSKFSNHTYIKLKLGKDNFFKINKLCEIQVDNKKNIICIAPLINKSLTEYKAENFLNIEIDKFRIELPLVWKTGYFEFINTRFRWTLKKNRFQITIHSSKKRIIQINNESLELFPNKKLIYHKEYQTADPEIHLRLYNKNGGTKFSKIGKQQVPVIASGFATTKNGTLTNKILYSSNQRKHQLFDIKDSFHDVNEIQILNDDNKIKFFSKHTSNDLEIHYLKNEFLNRLKNLSFSDSAKLLLLIDIKFIGNIKNILLFFKLNFGFQPEFIIKDKKSNIKLKSNLIIEFVYKLDASGLDQYEIREKNVIILKGNKYNSLLQNLEKLIKNNRN